MTTPLGDKLGASMINVSLMAFASVPLYVITPDVDHWRASLVATFAIYNILTRKRCLGMRLMGTHIEPPSTIAYLGSYSAAFATILYWVQIPFDLLAANTVLQFAAFMRTGNTLHGYLTRNSTMTRDERLELAKIDALVWINRGKLKDAVLSMGLDIKKIDGDSKLNTGLFYVAMEQAIAGDAEGVKRYIEGFN